MTIKWFDTVKSTNDVAMQLPDSEQGYCIAAMQQTKGRGQRGSVWQSNSGENLLASFVFKTPFTVENHFCTSMIASLAITAFLETLKTEAKIKWPNDIFTDGKKIAGILIENDILGTNVTKTVIGIGLNLNQTKFEGFSATSILLVSGKKLELQQSAQTLQQIMMDLWTQYSTNTALLKKTYQSQLFALNGAHYAQGKERFFATIVDVDFDGQIHLETINKEKKCFYFKQVEFLHL